MPKRTREARIPKMSPAIPGGYVLSKIVALKTTTGATKNQRVYVLSSARRSELPQ